MVNLQMRVDALNRFFRFSSGVTGAYHPSVLGMEILLRNSFKPSGLCDAVAPEATGRGKSSSSTDRLGIEKKRMSLDGCLSTTALKGKTL